MATNHIIIGLGGRGGDSLKAFRKTLFKNALTREKADSYPIQYIYVDSDRDDLQSGWNDELGINYGINDWAKINTRENLEWSDFYDNLMRYPTISAWLGDKKAWAEISVNTEKGSGQLRKLGRAYFVASVYNQRDNAFHKVLQVAHQNVIGISRSSSETIYHIIAGLSGGTGSGTVIDVISLVSKFIGENSFINDKIIVYAILPERNQQGKDVLGFYYPNAYAALKEINAIGLYSETEKNQFHYRPLNIESFVRGEENRIDANYMTCFVFSNENEKSRVIDYDKGLPNMIGDFLYHTIINLPTSPEGLNAYEKLTENGVILTETDTFTGGKERAVKFASASIKRIEIPEIEVIDLYGAWMAQHFLWQQMYNNWQDGKGYLNAAGEDKTSDFVENRSRKDNFLQACEITLDFLSLKTPHSGGDLRSSNDEWDTVSARLFQNSLNVYTGGKEKMPIQYFRTYMDGFFSTQFRGNGMGVEKYWDEKTRDIEQQTNYFFKKIESYLLDLWVTNGERTVGLNEVAVILDRLKNELKTIATRAANRISHLSDPNKFDVKDADFTNAGCNYEINKLLADFGKIYNLQKTKTFESAASFITKLYKNKTDIIAYQFAINLIKLLTRKLDDLSDTIQKLHDEVTTAQDKLNDIISEKYKLFRKADSNDQTYYSNNVKMLYRQGAVEQEFTIIINEKNIFQHELRSFRKFIRKKCAAASFYDLHKFLNVDLLTQDYLYYLNAKVPSVYERLQDAGKIKANDKLVGRNVLNYFQNEFKSFDDLDVFFKNIKDETGVYAKLSSTNAETLDSTGLRNYANDRYVIQYPAYRISEEAERYERQFHAVITRIFPGAEIVVSLNGERCNELTVFKAKANMSIRSFDIVSNMMHEKYIASFMKQSKMAELTVHTEGSSGNFPKIIPFNDSEKEMQWERWFDNELIGYCLLAYTLGFIEKNRGKYILTFDPGNDQSTTIEEISGVGDKFYAIKDFMYQHDICQVLEVDERFSQRLITAITNFINRRENKKEVERKAWMEDIVQTIIPGIYKEDYDEDKTDKEYYKILKGVEWIKKELFN